MNIIEKPQVYLIGITKMEHEAVGEWLEGLGGRKVLKGMAGTEAEQLSELAGRRCYKAFAPGLNPNVTKIRSDSAKYHANLLQMGHGSVYEHNRGIFAFEGISRVFTHELCRNRAGMKMQGHNQEDEEILAVWGQDDTQDDDGYSQESLRYVRLDNLDFWIPPTIQANKEAMALFKEAVETMEQWQKKLADIFQIENIESFAEKKKLTSCFRRIAPIGLATGIIWSSNLRALRWVLEQRTSRHAEVEIRIVFNEVGDIALKKWPFIFQDFKKIDTNDGLCEFVPDNSKI